MKWAWLAAPVDWRCWVVLPSSPKCHDVFWVAPCGKLGANRERDVCVCAKWGKKLSPTKAMEWEIWVSNCPGQVTASTPWEMTVSKYTGSQNKAKNTVFQTSWHENLKKYVGHRKRREIPDKQLGIKAAANYPQEKEELRLTGRLVEDLSCHSCSAVETAEVVTRNSLQRLKQSHWQK